MKKNKILLLSTAALLGIGAGVALASTNIKNVEAATFVDNTSTDTFDDGIDLNNYDVIDSENKVGLVEKNGVLTFGHSDQNVGYFRTGNVIHRGTKSLVFQFKKIDLGSEWHYIQFTSTYSWATDMLMIKLDGNFISLNGVTSPVNVSSNQTTPWIDTSLFTHYRFVWNNDGSLDLYGSTDGVSFSKACYYGANSFTPPSDGYLGFYGGSLNGTITIDNAKVGVADDKDLTNLVWTVEDDFETANSGKFIMDPVVCYSDTAVFEQKGAMRAVLLDNAASGAGFITKKSFSYNEYASKLFDAKLTLEKTELGTKAVGLGFGLDNNATSVTSAYFVGVRATTTGHELVLFNNGEVVKTAAITSLNDQFAIDANVSLNENDESVLLAKVGNVSLESVVTNPEGKLSVGLLGEGTSIVKVVGLTTADFKGSLETGRTISTDFEKGFDHNWLVQEGANGSIKINDGVLNFKSQEDNTFFQTRYKYSNFDIKFDAKLQQLEEDELGNVIHESTWLGLSIGRKNYDDAYKDRELIYYTGDTVNSIKTHNGYTPSGVATARGWFEPAYLPLSSANKDVMFHYHIRAVDGLVSFGVSRENLEETTVIYYENVDTLGYIAFAGTQGANYYVDNIVLTSLEKGTTPNNVPVVANSSVEVEQGKTLNAKVSATDLDAYDSDYLSYELVEDSTSSLGELAFNKDGNYTFVAKEGVTGTVSFTFKANDTEDDSEVATITITVKEKSVVPPDDPQVEPGDEPETPSVPETKEENKGGLNAGAIIGIVVGSVVVVGAAAIGAALLIKRKRAK